MFRDNMRRTADTLISKYGMDIVLMEAIPGAFDPTTGKNAITYTPHNIKAHISPYSTSEIIPNVIDVKDIKVLIYADNFSVTKDWYVKGAADDYNIINIAAVLTQNAPVVIELQCRSRHGS